MVEWVYRAALAAECADEVVIATPDQEILDAAKAFGAPAVLTRQDHPSGTDRLAEVAESISADVYVNLQGDEPLIDSATIRACAKALQASSSADASSVYAECSESELDEPSAVKVVLRSDETALYFSRFSLPYPRNPRELPVWKHIGIYAYRPETLRRFVTLGPSPLELTEGLEQLRLLENGLQIQMVKGVASPISVDTPEQAVTANELLLLRGA
jgi:3-deoxy-manno-octulosonate cytidylyltransferase (CMP-KDO synthetase)